jgi:hypothetical protein
MRNVKEGSMPRLHTSILASLILLHPVPAGAEAIPEWRSGFETGFPGEEWLDYDGGAWTESGVPNPGLTEAWTIVDPGTWPHVLAGEHAYKGWILDASSDGSSHRAYPGIHVDIPSPLVNRFWVWLEADYDAMSDPEWIHFATWGNNPDWEVHTMSVRRRRVEMAHLDWSYIGPEPQPDFPLGRWVRFTVYIHYPPAGDGHVHVWQDGVPVLEGHYTTRTGQNLMRAHWGMYASGSVDQGTQYNDEIQIWSLTEPLTDFTTEPPSPYDDPVPPDGEPDASTDAAADPGTDGADDDGSPASGCGCALVS